MLNGALYFLPQLQHSFSNFDHDQEAIMTRFKSGRSNRSIRKTCVTSKISSEWPTSVNWLFNNVNVVKYLLDNGFLKEYLDNRHLFPDPELIIQV